VTCSDDHREKDRRIRRRKRERTVILRMKNRENTDRLEAKYIPIAIGTGFARIKPTKNPVLQNRTGFFSPLEKIWDEVF
jgi:hypothetical protein